MVMVAKINGGGCEIGGGCGPQCADSLISHHDSGSGGRLVAN